MQGRRVYPPVPTEEFPHPLPLDTQQGDYWYQPDLDRWMCFAPMLNGHGGFALGDLSKHTVIEHEDGTITVSPSILITCGQDGEQWHGYLERGIWREV